MTLAAGATETRVFIDIEDECGGLPPGGMEDLFQPFSQRGVDRTGVGLGLSISRKGSEANGGTLTAQDLPGRGCVFTIDLPRKPPPPRTTSLGGIAERQSTTSNVRGDASR